nr:GNAT family N-acetyltransferase [Paracoccus salsus]
MNPVPASLLPEAAALWWRGVWPGPWLRPPPPMRASHGIAALDAAGGVAGIAGLRDAGGGFLVSMPWLARLAFRPAPPTTDLVIDGIVVRTVRRGTGRALIAAADAHARAHGHTGLRAEVEASNRVALAFYLRLGFVEMHRGRFGWPWSGQVLILRRDPGTDTARPERAASPADRGASRIGS